MENGNKEKILNPFALPPETNARFNLLLVSVIVLSLILGQYLPVYFMSEKNTDVIFPKVNYTEADINSKEDIKESGMNMITKSLEYLPSILISFLIISVAFFFSFYLYKKHPGDIIRKKNLKPADRSENSKHFKLINDVKNISAQYGTEPPEIYISKDFTAGAQAFGFKKKYMLRIDNGLRMMSYKNFDVFKAIILHETGHIINKDVTKTYIARSLWRAVLIVFAVPTLLVLLYSYSLKIINRISDGLDAAGIKEIFFKSIPSLLLLLFSISVFFLIINLLLKSLVRTREYYADWRASAAGSKEELIKMFEADTTIVKKRGYLKSLFFWHPEPYERTGMLKDTSGLFLLKKDICFLVGLLIPFSLMSLIALMKTGLTVTGLVAGAGQLISQDLVFTSLFTFFTRLLLMAISFIPFFVTSYLISSSLGLQIQRNVVASLSGNLKTYFTLKDVFLSALITTCGMAAGCILLPYFSLPVIFINTGISEFIFEKIPLLILSFLLAYSVNFFWIFYVKYFSGKVYGRHIKNKPPLKRFYIFNIASALLLSVMILPAAGFFFRVYSNDNNYLNDITNTLLLLLPLIYLLSFMITGVFLIIVNSLNSACSHCGKNHPPGVLFGKECANCGSVLSAWLYI
jgi:Zn-dependent protease with chaperone function